MKGDIDTKTKSRACSTFYGIYGGDILVTIQAVHVGVMICHEIYVLVDSNRVMTEEILAGLKMSTARPEKKIGDAPRTDDYTGRFLSVRAYQKTRSFL